MTLPANPPPSSAASSDTPAEPSREPAPIDLATESVAGEEGPGASIDLVIAPVPASAPAPAAPPPVKPS